jgi:steroid delta-isomerase-like uncharacterized protein
MSAQDNATLIQTLLSAYNNLADQFAAHATDDCVAIDVPSGMTFNGPDGLRLYIQTFITAFPDGQIQATNLFTTNDHGLLEVLARGTHTGPLTSPAGEIPPTGRSIELRYCVIYQFRNGRVASVHYYYDQLSFLQQLGIIPQQV